MKHILWFAVLGVASFALSGVVARPVVADDRAAVTPRHAFAGDDIPDSLRGKSRQLKARFVTRADRDGVGIIEQLFGREAAAKPGVYTLADSLGQPLFSYVVMHPFEIKKGSLVGAYKVGYWPDERGKSRNAAYHTPSGFIEVTEANQDAAVSTHFRLRDFLTKNQSTVWPKYLVLSERLIDKLELIMTELKRSGYVAEHLTVMSGFRTPDHNRTVRSAGASADSRHQYGDAADIIVDSDENGRMDDLNRDGKLNSRDIALLVGAVERVEALNPDMVGGLGIYRPTKFTSGYIHVDVRGDRIRWGSY
jgi:uncharacterized protein YcbK (DUF882 family)